MTTVRNENLHGCISSFLFICCTLWQLHSSLVGMNESDDGEGDGEGDLESYHVLAEGVGIIVDHLQQLLHGSVKGGNDFPEEEKFR